MRTTVLIGLVLIAPTCCADELVLTDVDWVGGVTAPISGHVPMRVELSPSFVDERPTWTNDVSQATVGNTFVFDRESVDDTLFYRFNLWLFNMPSDLYVLLPSGGNGINPPSVVNYHLTQMTLSIDSYITDFEPTPAFPDGRLRIDYTLNIFGAPGTVPEPTSAVMVFLAIIGLSVGLSRTRAVT